MSISVVIITKNEEATIERCLRSVAWADEVIVLDSDSTSGTQSKCRERAFQVFQSDWQGVMNGVRSAETVILATSRLSPGLRDCVTLTSDKITLIVDTPTNYGRRAAKLGNGRN
jgi:glycosyltransferase involved in cell wall biosynthesis